MSIELLCTLGPSSYSEGTIRRLDGIGATLFRINLSHTKLSELDDRLTFIQRYTRVPICIDTEGAQVRTGNFVVERIELRDAATLRLPCAAVPGDSSSFNLYPADIVRHLEEGDFISIDFNSVLVQVVGFEGERDVALTRVINGGIVGRNKAVTVDRELPLPALTDKDTLAIELAKRRGIRHFALSFAGRGSDVDRMRELCGPGTHIISKIESLQGLANIEEISRKSDAILIDRGDLSRQLPIERIPRAQKEIIATAKSIGRKVYVATNLLESMVTSGSPTRAEVNDVYNTLLDGADGLVLAAETAIGADPVRCATMIVRLVREYAIPSEGANALSATTHSLLVPPHGGRLVQRVMPTEREPALDNLKRLEVGETDLLDCEQIALGTYSPLEGFMDSASLETVLGCNRLPDGTIWTMPVVLQVVPEQAAGICIGDRVALASRLGTVHATIDVTEIFTVDLEQTARRWFGTDSTNHPGANRLLSGGTTFLAGPITLIARLPMAHRQYVLSPQQARFVFAHKGWSKVVGFHTRNPAHRAHEHIQLKALERTHADGLFISPVVGTKKRDDFLPDPIIRSYQMLLDFGIYPPGKAVLGCFPTYSRYCGPREAVFTALCRKNMGCSHFIVGRDHTGVGTFYAADANRRMFESLGDLGVEILEFGSIGYDPRSGDYVEDSPSDDVEPISGTRMRESLRTGEPLPEWFMRDFVQQALRTRIAAGHPVFVN